MSKWKGLYEAEGGAALRLGYRGSGSYLQEEQRQAILQWIEARETVSVEAVRDYIEEQYGVGYRSNSRLHLKACKMGVGAREFLRFATLSGCDRSRV